MTTQTVPSTGRTNDLLLRGGRVVDPESGRDEVADVVIADGRIVAVGSGAAEGLEATEVLDVSGLVVTAGFVDLHSHAQTIPSLRVQALDGVTTALELESGAGDVAAVLAEAGREGRPVNYGYSASWAQARMSLLDGTDLPGGFLDFARGLGSTGWQRRADRRELDLITGRLEEQLGAGALGIGVLLGYAPQTGRDEYLRVAGLAAAHGVPTFTHSRFKSPHEPGSALEGAAEVVAAAAGTGAHMHLCHLNSTSLRAVDEVAALVDGARSNGVTVTTEAYPYGAGMTAVGVPFLHPDRLADVGIGPSDLVLVATGERPRDRARLLEVREQDPGALVIIHYLDEDDAVDVDVINRALLLADTAIASDAVPFATADGGVVQGDVPMPHDALSHPRTSGTFSKFLRTTVRETGALTLAEALARCSLVPARFLEQASPAMRRKGRLQAGCDADVVVLDPGLVTDRSTYAEPARTSTGFLHVLVDGTSVVRDGAVVADAMPGRAVVGAA